jgi:hypothetical protein
MMGLMPLIACAGLGGCNSNPDILEAPQVLVSPYEGKTQEALWGVVPLGNESGVSGVDTYMVTDKLAGAIDEARGITCLPVNRTLAAMRALRMSQVRSPEDVRAIAVTMGVDALVVGTVTDYDPYNPPKIGLSVALYVRDAADNPGQVDPAKMQGAYSDDRVRVQSRYSGRPAASVSEHLDASNHDVLFQVQQYARGRHNKASASGWRGMLVSMDRYTEFAAYTVVSRLIDQERIRVGIPQFPPPASTGATTDAEQGLQSR